MPGDRFEDEGGEIGFGSRCDFKLTNEITVIIMGFTDNEEKHRNAGEADIRIRIAPQSRQPNNYVQMQIKAVEDPRRLSFMKYECTGSK